MAPLCRQRVALTCALFFAAVLSASAIPAVWTEGDFADPAQIGRANSVQIPLLDDTCAKGIQLWSLRMECKGPHARMTIELILQFAGFRRPNPDRFT